MDENDGGIEKIDSVFIIFAMIICFAFIFCFFYSSFLFKQNSSNEAVCGVGDIKQSNRSVALSIYSILVLIQLKFYYFLYLYVDSFHCFSFLFVL